MTETIDTQRTPGVVIFVAILNFVGAAFWAFATFLFSAILIFGNVLGWTDAAMREFTAIQERLNFTWGFNIVFIAISAASLFFLLFLLWLGIGLLRGNRVAWYVQIVMSVLGLLGFPIYTILNAVILVLFFQPKTRDYFKV